MSFERITQGAPCHRFMLLIFIHRDKGAQKGTPPLQRAAVER
ncbi:hypothetical protein W909_13255 [Dickeya zeae EC1]|nr:hypothetical protein W909_13255 [Dickeya zeae EC1]